MDARNFTYMFYGFLAAWLIVLSVRRQSRAPRSTPEKRIGRRQATRQLTPDRSGSTATRSSPLRSHAVGHRSPLSMLRPRRSVKALTYGHTHVYAFDKQDSLHLLNLTAVGYNFADGVPVGCLEASFSNRGADLKLHAIAGEMKDDGKTTSLTWR